MWLASARTSSLYPLFVAFWGAVDLPALQSRSPAQLQAPQGHRPALASIVKLKPINHGYCGASRTPKVTCRLITQIFHLMSLELHDDIDGYTRSQVLCILSGH